MFVFGVLVTDQAMYSSTALPGIAAYGGDDAVLITCDNQDLLSTSYDQILDHAAGLEGLDGVVFLDEGVALRDARLLERARQVFAEDKDVGAVGVVGSCGHDGPRWWTAEVHGDMRGSHPVRGRSGECDVDVLDGSALVLSPAVARRYRVGERGYELHGWDVDLAEQLRADGLRLRVVDATVERQSLGRYLHESVFVRDERRWSAQWRSGGVGLEEVGAHEATVESVADTSDQPRWRDSLLDLIPAGASSVVFVDHDDVRRCAAAARPGRRLAVVAPDGPGLAAARAHLDGAHVADLLAGEGFPSLPGLVDAIVVGEWLEFVPDPAALLRSMHAALRPGGVVIASVANARHWSVLLPLLVEARWNAPGARGLGRQRGLLTSLDLRALLDAAGFTRRVAWVARTAPPTHVGYLDTLATCAQLLGADAAGLREDLETLRVDVVVGPDREQDHA